MLAESDHPEVVLRDYQLKVIKEIETYHTENKEGRVLLVAPTGSGKTVIGSEIIRREVKQGGMVLVIGHRRELLHQFSDQLHAIEVNHAFIMAGKEKSLFPDVQLASIQTLSGRLKKGIISLPPATLLIIDEAHHINARTYMEVINHYEKLPIIGLTATPLRGDGKGLGAPQ